MNKNLDHREKIIIIFNPEPGVEKFLVDSGTDFQKISLGPDENILISFRA